MKNYCSSTRVAVILLIFPFSVSAQSDLDRILKGGELVIGGLSIFKILRSDVDKDEAKEAKEEKVAEVVPKPPVSKVVASFCIKNGLDQKIVFQLAGKDKEENAIEKELIIQASDQECLYELPKGIWSYTILIDGSEVAYKKGEYKLVDDTMTITIEGLE